MAERFAGETLVQARAILLPDQPDRVLLAVLALSGGDLGRLQHFSEAAAADWRDVLYWAEMDGIGYFNPSSPVCVLDSLDAAPIAMGVES